jgi:hypothetical protein
VEKTIELIRTSLVRHLTEEEFADRQRVDVQTAAGWRKDGTGPAYLLLTESRTKQTIRYRLADVEAWEESRLVVPGS